MRALELRGKYASAPLQAFNPIFRKFVPKRVVHLPKRLVLFADNNVGFVPLTPVKPTGPSLSLSPEAIAALTPLVFMQGPDAAQILRRRSPPAWLQIYIGMTVATAWKSRGKAGCATTPKRFAHHAQQWVWLDRAKALVTMAAEAKQSVAVAVAHVWVPARTATGNPKVIELGQPRADLFQGLCWKVLAEDLWGGEDSGIGGEGSHGEAGSANGTSAAASTQAASVLHAEPGQDGFWHRRPERVAGRYAGADLRGWQDWVSGPQFVNKKLGLVPPLAPVQT